MVCRVEGKILFAAVCLVLSLPPPGRGGVCLRKHGWGFPAPRRACQGARTMVKCRPIRRGVMGADAADALAVALTHAHVRSTKMRAGLSLKAAWN